MNWITISALAFLIRFESKKLGTIEFQSIEKDHDILKFPIDPEIDLAGVAFNMLVAPESF